MPCQTESSASPESLELLAEVGADLRHREREAWNLLRQILSRQDRPRIDDATNAADLCVALGLSPPQMGLFAAALEEEQIASKRASQVPEILQRLSAVGAGWSESKAQFDRAREAFIAKIPGINRHLQDLRCELQGAQSSADLAEGIRQAFPSLFGLDAKPSGRDPTPTLQVMREDLHLPPPGQPRKG